MKEVHYKLNLIQTKQLLKQLKKVLLEEHILEIFIQMLIKNGTVIYGKNLMN